MPKDSIRKRRKLDELRTTVQQQLDTFQEMFERDAGPEYRVFFDLLSVIPETDCIQIEIVRLMLKVRIPAELIYGYLHTGLLVTEESYEHLSPEDRYAWDRAIDEYVQRSERGS